MADDLNDENLLEEVVQLSEETEGDRERLRDLLRQGHLEKTSLLASQMVRTVHASHADLCRLLSRLLAEHQDGIVQLEDATYQSLPRAMDLLLKRLADNQTISLEVRKEVMQIIGTPSGGDSFLTQEDSALFKSLLGDVRKAVVDSPMGELTLERVDHALSRLAEIEAASSGGDDDESEDEASANAAPELGSHSDGAAAEA